MTSGMSPLAPEPPKRVDGASQRLWRRCRICDGSLGSCRRRRSTRRRRLRPRATARVGRRPAGSRASTRSACLSASAAGLPHLARDTGRTPETPRHARTLPPRICRRTRKISSACLSTARCAAHPPARRPDRGRRAGTGAVACPTRHPYGSRPGPDGTARRARVTVALSVRGVRRQPEDLTQADLREVDDVVDPVLGPGDVAGLVTAGHAAPHAARRRQRRLLTLRLNDPTLLRTVPLSRPLQTSAYLPVTGLLPVRGRRQVRPGSAEAGAGGPPESTEAARFESSAAADADSVIIRARAGTG